MATDFLQLLLEHPVTYTESTKVSWYPSCNPDLKDTGIWCYTKDGKEESRETSFAGDLRWHTVHSLNEISGHTESTNSACTRARSFHESMCQGRIVGAMLEEATMKREATKKLEDRCEGDSRVSPKIMPGVAISVPKPRVSVSNQRFRHRQGKT